MSRIAVWYPNAAVDHLVVLDALRRGEVQRSRREELTAGGKGANVLRALNVLGEPAVGATVAGGRLGALYRMLAGEDGLVVRASDAAAECRIATLVVEDDGEITVLNGPGPQLQLREWEHHVADVAALLGEQRPDYLVITGSFPPGADVTDLDRICERAATLGVRVAADAAGEILERLAQLGPDLLKVNLSEARRLLGERQGEDVAEVVAALARRVRAHCIVTNGGGVIASSAEGGISIRPPRVSVVNTVGCGDAFLAGLVKAYCDGSAPHEALSWATAVASASAETDTPSHFVAERAAQLLHEVELSRQRGGLS